MTPVSAGTAPTEAPPGHAVPRVLAAVGDPGTVGDLGLHLRTHGPLRLPARRSRPEIAALLAALAASGLTGRGGAGFPLAAKVAYVREQRRRPITVVNAMEGEPASLKDRVLATRAPHLVLDGADVAAAAVDAVAIVVCVPRDRPEAATALEHAIGERERLGIAGTPVEVRRAPSRYVAGEESALVHWVAGGDARPTFRRERPAVLRAAGRPVLVDNAETLAHTALVARHGAAWFRLAGTPEAPGTTLVTVSGAADRPGVYEVPLGTPIRSVLASAGADRPLAGVLLGGYGGTWLPPDHLGIALAPAPLAAVGASVGAGVVAALPEGACGLAETARIARWMAGESAGQCGPCVFGLPAVADDLHALAFDRAPAHAVERLRGRLAIVQGRGACRHPDGVVRLVRSALAAFDADLHRHVGRGPCDGARHPSVLPFPPRGEAGPWR